MFKIKSIDIRVHDTSFGGYPYRVDVSVQIEDLKAFAKLKGKLGSLVLDVNNAVYALNNKIPAYSPTVDVKRSSRGIKIVNFTYYMRDHLKAESLGLEIRKFKSGECEPKYGSHATIYSSAA